MDANIPGLDVGVAIFHSHFFKVYAEGFGDDLSQDGFGALANFSRSSDKSDMSKVIDFHNRPATITTVDACSAADVEGRSEPNPTSLL